MDNRDPMPEAESGSAFIIAYILCGVSGAVVGFVLGVLTGLAIR